MEDNKRTLFRIKAISKGLGMEGMYILILKEYYGDMLFPLPISKEMQEVFMAQLHVQPYAAKNILSVFRQINNVTGIIIKDVTITHVVNGAFIAKIGINNNGEESQLTCDAPSALLIALYNRVSIYISNELLVHDFSRADKDSFTLPIKSLDSKFIQEALSDAIHNEQYELATLLRDELKKRS